MYIDFGQAASWPLTGKCADEDLVLSSRAVDVSDAKRVSQSCDMQVACSFRTSSVCYIRFFFCQI